jgi:hypothetical protein
MIERRSHWVQHNHQERMPPRMIAFDTEGTASDENGVESQTWKLATAIRWRTDLKTGDKAEAMAFRNPHDFWTWVSEYCRENTRTVVWCHNLGYDARISQVFTVLPALGFRLEWCNLDRNVSSMTWRSDHGTLVFADTWTWLPLPLHVIAPAVGLVKFDMPPGDADPRAWNTYCMRDTEIVYNVVRRLMTFIKTEGLGNWQPTGAGMSMATWRHKFLTDKILVHDDQDAIDAERSAMYTGRAEAWKHGKLPSGLWTEVDLRNAYLTIASECTLPRKLHMSTGCLNTSQYAQLCARFAILAYARITTETPALPVRDTSKIIWPVGAFEGWYWDTELDSAVRSGAKVTILRSHVYTKAPLLKGWAEWVLGILRADNDDTDPVVRTWIKHCSRALIGRLALRTPSWQPWGGNPEGITGITTMIDAATKEQHRMLHVGEDTLLETGRTESRNSLPQVTGWIMAECRVRLWEAMNHAGLENIAHVDTDSVLVSNVGLRNLRDHYGSEFGDRWTLKGTYSRLEVLGPRTYFRDKQRVAAGIPSKAEQQPDGSITGERWASLAADMNVKLGTTVTIQPAVWHMKRTDPRRQSAAGTGHETVPYQVG